MISIQRAAWNEYVSQLRLERRYWKRLLRKDSNDSYSRGKIAGLTFAIEQTKIWKEVK